MDILRVIFSGKVFGDLVHRARAEQRDPCDDVFEVSRLELKHKLAHAGGFKLEYAIRICCGDHLVHFRIIILQLFQVRDFFPLLPDVFERIANHRKRSEAKKVHF